MGGIGLCQSLAQGMAREGPTTLSSSCSPPICNFSVDGVELHIHLVAIHQLLCKSELSFPFLQRQIHYTIRLVYLSSIKWTFVKTIQQKKTTKVYWRDKAAVARVVNLPLSVLGSSHYYFHWVSRPRLDCWVM